MSGLIVYHEARSCVKILVARHWLNFPVARCLQGV